MASGVFHVVDYIIFVLTLVISLVIGLSFAYLGRNEQSTDEYLMGGRKMKLVPVAISMCVSFISTNTFLGAPAEMYTYGVHYALSIFILPVSLLLVVGLFVPLIYPLRLTSINKVSETPPPTHTHTNTMCMHGLGADQYLPCPL